MSVGASHADAVCEARRLSHQRSDVARSDFDMLRRLCVGAGIGWAIVFVAAGLAFELQTYGDGSIFSYAVAARDAWAFHWHNISGRLFVYLFSLVPAETYVALTGDARGGITAYGLLFFAPQALGLMITYAADVSPRRIFFTFACASTATLCPLVFGFPTEMWMAHALFWPALTLCHCAPDRPCGRVAVALVLLALLFTHAGALVFAAAILLTLWLRGGADHAFARAAWSLAGAFAALMFVRARIPPDDYFAPVLRRAAWHVFDPNICIGRMVILIGTSLAGYGLIFASLRRAFPARAHLYAGLVAAGALALYWLYAYNPVHAERRYYMRTMLVLFTPAFGAVAAALALQSAGLLRRQVPYLPALLSRLSSPQAARAAAGALALVTLIHATETAKFVTAWTQYRAALRALVTGTASDPTLGDAAFVSSARLGPDLNRLAWFSTTPYLSVLAAKDLRPARLAIDPAGNYFWLSCATAANNADADNAIPRESRALIRLYSCMHRD